MSINKQQMADIFENCAAELYDLSDNYTNDIVFLKKLMAEENIRRILEPFAGTGRVMAPLLEDQYQVDGLDHSKAMLARAHQRIRSLKPKATKRASLKITDVVDEAWPPGYDLVFLGANCFWQLGSAEEQKSMIKKTADSLRPGGFVYIENDNMEGELPDSWCQMDEKPRPWKSPRGACCDGTKVSSTIQVIDFNKARRLWKARRRVYIEKPDGTILKSQWITNQTHPSSAVDIESWLQKHDFEILGKYRSTSAEPYEKNCSRPIFWAQKKSQ